MALTHNSTLADSEPAWSSVTKSKLPRVAYARRGEANKKSTWRFPHHWVRDGGDLDEDLKVFTSGDMFLHRGGTIAAKAAVQGARTGKKPKDAGAIARHLNPHLTAIGLDRIDMAWTPQTATMIALSTENISLTDQMVVDIVRYHMSQQKGVYIPEKLTDEQLKSDWSTLNRSWNEMGRLVAPFTMDSETMPISAEAQTLYRAGLDIYRELYYRNQCSPCMSSSILARIYSTDPEFMQDQVAV